MSNNKNKTNAETISCNYYYPYLPIIGDDFNTKSWMCECYRCHLNGTQFCTKSSNLTNTLNPIKPVEIDLKLKETMDLLQNYKDERPVNVQSFEAIAYTLPILYERKNTAYSDSFTKSVSKYGKIAALTRMSDKWNRLENLMLNGGSENDESLTDTLLDLASYCVMTISALHNHQVDDLVTTLIGKKQ